MITSNFIPVAGEQTNGIEQTTYYAQMIVKAFSDALDKNNCLTKIPVAIGLEISTTIEDLKDIKEIIGGIGGVDDQLATPDPDRQIKVISPNDDTDYTGVSAVQEQYGVSKKKVLADLKQFAEDCFDCDLDMDIMGAFKNLINGIRQQIDFLKNKLKGLKDLLDFDLTSNFDGLMDIGNIFANMCIKDLNMISAMLLQALLDFNADINIGGIGEFSFSLGVMQQMMSVIFNGIRDILNYAMKPVNCAITALETIAEAIPSERAIARRLGQQKTNQLYHLTGVDLNASPENKYSQGLQQMIGKIQKNQQDISQAVYEQKKKTEEMVLRTNDAIGKAMSQIDKKYQDVLGISKYVTCEQTRTGSTRGAVEGGLPTITADIKLMAGLVNLIRSIIKKKVKKSLLEQGYNQNIAQFKPVQNKGLEISQVDVAEAIAEAFDASAKVTNTAEGNIAVLFVKKTPDTIDKKLNLKICNTEIVMKNNHIQDIIKEVIDEIQSDKVTPGGKTTLPSNPVPGNPVSNPNEVQINKVTNGKNVVLVVPQYSQLIRETFNILKQKDAPPLVDAASVSKAAIIKCATSDEIIKRFSLIKA